MLSMAKNHEAFMFRLSCCGIAFNIFVLFTGILKNPGIPQVYLDRILKEKLTGKTESVGSQSESASDLEAGTSAK